MRRATHETVPATRADVVELLNAEIETQASIDQRAGWTPYAVLVALAGVVWLALDVLAASKPDWSKVALLYTAVIALLHSGRSTSSLVARPSMQRFQGRPRFLSMGWFWVASRPGLLFAALNWSVTAAVVAIVGWPLSPVLTCVIELYVLGELCVACVALVLGAIDFSFPVEATAFVKRSAWGLILIGPVGLVAALISGLMAMTPVDPMPVAEMKLGALVAAVVCLTEYLADAMRTGSDGRQLVAIRRALFLGQIDPDEARQHAEAVLEGMTAEQYLHGEVQECRELAASLVQQATSAIVGAGPVHEIMNAPLTVTPERLASFARELGERKEGRALLERRVAELLRMRSRLERRVGWIVVVAPTMKASCHAAMRDLDAVIRKAQAAVADLGEFLNACGNQQQSAEHPPKRAA